MIKIDKTTVYGFEESIRGMRNPMNSWGKSDSKYEWIEDPSPINPNDPGMAFTIGSNDHDLMIKLAKAGSVHAKFRRMIVVYADITAPLYWWKHADAYKVGTVSNSCSTMHRIHEKEFTLDDFSHEHLTNEPLVMDESGNVVNLNVMAKGMLEIMIGVLNAARNMYIKYEVLANIYQSRKNHKLDEWRDFCLWIEGLPYSEIITVLENK